VLFWNQAIQIKRLNGPEYYAPSVAMSIAQLSRPWSVSGHVSETDSQ